MTLNSQAQNNHINSDNHNHDRCGSDHIRALQQNNQSRVQRIAEIENFTQHWVTNNNKGSSGAVITIPVVVHVLWNNPAENISHPQIQSQIDVLNQDFRKLNADTTSIPPAFQSLAADTEIEFVLAKQDVNGLPTTGINRVQTSINEVGHFNSNHLLQVSPSWDTASYLNIYVCEITDAAYILGYATPPGQAFNGLDGVVVDYRYFGNTSNTVAPYNLGRTLTHEVGHYLNLLHIWGNSISCSTDDLVGDTPSQSGPNFGCNTHPLPSCNSNDMFMNFMDYGDDACIVMFSQGQKMRMLATLNGPRSGLLTSQGTLPSLANTIFVNRLATGQNNGTSWDDAYISLSVALTNATANNEIWVAKGMYIPGGEIPTRADYFTIPDSVKLYGGFDGMETKRIDRDPQSNLTIISGDIQRDDIEGDLTTNKSDNSYHVMVLNAQVSNATIIDGFTITGGFADTWNQNDVTNRHGGGILCYGSPVIKNCIFEDNYAMEGGALHFRMNSNLIIIENSIFLNNASTWTGGAILAFDSDILIKDCHFEDNNGGLSGTIYMQDSDIKIENGTFVNNTAEFGGAIDVLDSDLEITNTLFENNTADFGGAISSFQTFLPTLINITSCGFNGNQANIAGGAINSDNVSIEVMSSIFDGNTAGRNGGAMKISNTSYSITNSLIINNVANGDGLGGGFYVEGSVAPTDLTLINSTVANNQGSTTDGIYSKFSDYVTLNLGNTILANGVRNFASDNANITINTLQGNVISDNTLAFALTHTTDKHIVNPSFRDPFNNDFRLNNGSPAHDIGNASIAPVLDLDGLDRIGQPDAGAFEYRFAVSTENEPITLDIDIKAYPNPTVDKLTLDIENEHSGEITFQMVDATGKLIRTWSAQKNGHSYQEAIHVKELTSGLYQIIISQENERNIVRFIKL